MAHKVLISAPYLQNDFIQFEEELIQKGIDFDVYPVNERMEEYELLPLISKYHGVICGDDRFTAKVLDKAANLKAIVKWGTGIDSIDKKYAESKGIAVRNTLDAFSQPVSESVIAYILAFSRRIIESDQVMKTGGWEKTFGFTLSEQTIGIIGFGNIGKTVARKLLPFNSKLLVTDILSIDENILKDLNCEQVDLEVLLNNADYISVNCDLNKSSKHLICEKTLTQMKSNAYLMNTARGPIVKESDLIKALELGTIAGAALDVFEDEPLSKTSPLRKMNNVLLSSHDVNASPAAWNYVHRNSLNMLYQELGI